MSDFLCFDANVYLCYFKQEGKEWLGEVNSFFDNMGKVKQDVVINKRTRNFVRSYITSIDTILSSDEAKKDLQKAAKTGDKRALEKIRRIIDAVDEKQFEKIIEGAIYFYGKGRYAYAIYEGISMNLIGLIDAGKIKFLDCGIKSSKFISELAGIDPEDAVLLSEVNAIKHEHYASGKFYTEDEHFFMPKTDPFAGMGFHILHIKKMKPAEIFTSP
ncbi:MAG: hypothetical protein V1676_07715 [Candidatus Diapherotrites archaeon]